MKTTQHTPEPWRAVQDPCPTARNRWLIEKRAQGWKTYMAEVFGDPEHPGGKEWQGSKEANAARIVACVNACAGMADPAADLAALRSALDCLLRLTERAGLCPPGQKRCEMDMAREALARTERRPA